MSDRAFDILVVGAGPAGLAAALAFARDGFETCLVGIPDARRNGRTVALLEGSVRFLQALGLGPLLESAAVPLVTMRIIDDTGSLFCPPSVSFQAHEIGLDALGWNLENGILVKALSDVAATTAGLTLFGACAEGVDLTGNHANLRLEGGQRLQAALIVAADGRNSRLRASARIITRCWAYPQAALTTLIDHHRDHDGASVEFHTRNGPFTLAPLPGQRSGVVWVTSPNAAKRLAALDGGALAGAIERQARSIFGKMVIAGPTRLVPISGLSVAHYISTRLALVAEAAHVFPPIGAQGLNLGLRDVAALRDTIVDARDQGADIGGAGTLAAYQRSRELDVPFRTAAVDGLNRMLLCNYFAIDLLRGAGLLALASLGPLRRAVIRETVLPLIGAPRLMSTA
jgi:2-octaprenyl-6-methoxyphenol hydroxylase